MIAPIRDTSPTETRGKVQRRKARRWIVESLLSRPVAKPRAVSYAAWRQWACAAWIVLVAIVYLIHMLGSYLGRT